MMKRFWAGKNEIKLSYGGQADMVLNDSHFTVKRFQDDR